MLTEFRDFVMRGNIIELAVAFIAGIAFNLVVTSLVDDVIMQVVAGVVGEPDFSRLSFSIRDADVRYGEFLTTLINFLITMAAVFFLLVKPINAVTERFVSPTDSDQPTNRECTECLAEVPAKARKCRFCASVLTPAA